MFSAERARASNPRASVTMMSRPRLFVHKMELEHLLSSETLEILTQASDLELDTLFLAAYERIADGERIETTEAPAEPPPTAVPEPLDAEERPVNLPELAAVRETEVQQMPARTNQPRPHGQFARPVADEEITRMRAAAQDTKYCTNVWFEWSNYCREVHSSQIPPLTEITPPQLQYWLTRFVLEVRKKNSTEYPSQTLHHLCSGLLRYLRQNGHLTLDIYKDSLFAEFRATLDAEMKRLQRLGIGSKTKQAEPLTEEEEEILWQKGLLGDHTPQALLNTMVFMSGLYFALRSGREHRELRFDSSQISLVERGGERPYLEYTEDDSKNRPAGLKGCYIERKTVKHHANLSNPSRCFVRLFSLYRSRCPANPKRNYFYLQCLKKPTEKVWFSREPPGHNALSKISWDSRLQNEPFASSH